MSHIDLYAAHSLDAAASCDELAQLLAAQLEAIDQYDTVNRGRVETARRILGDQLRRAAYNSLLADPAAHIDEKVLASIASGTSSAPTLPPVGQPQQWTPVPQQYPTTPQAQPVSQPRPAQQPVVTRTVVVPAGIMPKQEMWADQWTVEVQDNGATLMLTAHGNGRAARKRHKAGESSNEGWFTGGLIGGALGS
ncbi:hypothetical protein ACWDTG_24470 [Rhodococcus zopfii]